MCLFVCLCVCLFVCLFVTNVPFGVGCASTQLLDGITWQPTQQLTQASNSTPVVSVAGEQQPHPTQEEETQ